MNTNDIYNVIDCNLMNKGYTNLNDIPYEVLEEGLKRYMQFKLHYMGEDKSIYEYLSEIEKQVPEEEKLRTMGNFIHYLISYLSILQGFHIVWYIENVEEPIWKASEYVEGKIDGLITSDNIDYGKTFKFVLEKIKETLERGKVR